MANLIELMKQASMEAMEQGKPMNVVFGTVVSAEPLRIDIELHTPLGAPFLVLTRNVRDYTVEMTVEHETGDPISEPGISVSRHKHTYQGRKIVRVHNSLKKGEQVILLRLQGGDRYLVLDRVG